MSVLGDEFEQLVRRIVRDELARERGDAAGAEVDDDADLVARARERAATLRRARGAQ